MQVLFSLITYTDKSKQLQLSKKRSDLLQPNEWLHFRAQAPQGRHISLANRKARERRPRISEESTGKASFPFASGRP